MRPTGPGFGGVSGATHGWGMAQGNARTAPRSASRCDAQLGRLFQDLRALIDLTQGSVAIRLGTSVGTIKALEAGLIDVLPPQGETSRIVVAYAGLAGIDPTPILMRLAEHYLHRPEVGRTGESLPYPGGIVETVEPADPAVERSVPRVMQAELAEPTAPPRGERNAAATGQASRRRRNSVWLLILAIGLPLLLVAGLAAVVVNASLTYRILNALPEPLARAVRPVYDGLVLRFAREFEGMKWVDVADPGARRADKLQQRP